MKEPVISVGLISSGSINFELYGEFRIRGISRHFSGKFSAVWEKGKIRLIGNDFSETFDGLILEPRDPLSETFLLKDITIGINFHWEQTKSFRFNGALKLIVCEREIMGINLVSLEQYLVSVIGSEMAATSSKELLKAHAIISRSWVLAQMKAKKESNLNGEKETQLVSDDEIIKWYDREDHNLFDFCADDHCQRYQGVFKNYNDRAITAVEETRGIVIRYKDEICDTRFSKCCGGISESFENVWQPVHYEYLSAVVDYKFEPENYEINLGKEESAIRWIKGTPSAFCNTRSEKILSQVLVNYDRETKDFYRWKVEYTQEKLSEIITKKSGIDFGMIKELIPVQRGDSGRLIKLKIVGTKNEMIIGKELEIRRVLSESHLFSAAFIVERSDIKDGIPGIFTIRGGGWGHGVGLCQIGAAVMGEMGYMFDEILLHYFKKARIEKIYS